MLLGRVNASGLLWFVRYKCPDFSKARIDRGLMGGIQFRPDGSDKRFVRLYRSGIR